MDKLTRFFWFSAGAFEKGLSKYPELKHKYVGIGATVFFTGLFAALSGGYAMYFVFSGSEGTIWKALLFGLLWGLVIFNIDRYLVSTIQKNGSVWLQLALASPRLILAVLIGLVVARPLELKLFEKEINERLRTTIQNRHQAELVRNERAFNQKYAIELGQLEELKTQRDTLEQHIQNETIKLKQETFGTRTSVTSGIIGFGPYAKERQATLNKQERYLDSLRLKINLAQNQLLSFQQKEGLTEHALLHSSALDSAVLQAGFADRNATLSQLAYFEDGTKDKATSQALLFISLLFIFLECLPVFVKLMSPRDAYDHYLTNRFLRNSHVSDRKLEEDVAVTDQLQSHKVNTKISKRLNTDPAPIS